MNGPAPRLHVLVPGDVLARPDFGARASALRAACGPGLALHLRAPEAVARRLLAAAEELAADARRLGGWCVVNERLDVALAAGAQAVQLGAGALPVAEARALAAPGMRLGASVHSSRAARDARDDGADYLVAGTTYESATHPGRPPAGPALLAACAAFGIPVIAIGGITAERVPEVVAAGARGVAVIRAVWGAADPVGAALRLLATLERAHAGGGAVDGGGPG